MLIRFNEISPLGSHYEVHSIEGIGEPLPDLTVRGPVDARFCLTRKGDNKIELQGHLKATLVLTCDRCLSLYDSEVETELQVLFEVESDESWHVKDLEYKIPDLDTVLLDEPVIDLEDVVREQLYLAVPMKNLCSEQCKGVCPQCGTNLNGAVCGCADESKVSPFAALAQLKKS